MRIKQPSRKLLTAALLLVSPIAVFARSPAVSVGLKASWNAAPYLLELLETAALENPNSYYPLLSAISSADFNPPTQSEQALYTEFLRLATDRGYLSDPEELSSFNLALSVHAAAPRIEAHYQYYNENLVPKLGGDYKAYCYAWVQWGEKQLCDIVGESEIFNKHYESINEERILPFDRTTGNEDGSTPVAILYGDIGSREFKLHLDLLQREAEKGKLTYRVRYRPTGSGEERAVILSGYGVELVMKKTDYMVMDDRDVDAGEKEEVKASEAHDSSSGQAVLEDTESQDIEPLSSKELAGIGHKAAAFIMASEKPFETMSKLLMDFPKYSAKVSAVETNSELATEHRENFEMVFGPGVNKLYINGLEMSDSQLNAFSLLEHLRGERKLMTGFKKLGLDASQALRLLTHPSLTAENTDDTQRFDYRDTNEDGDIIFWMNDLEKDPRYKEFSPNVFTLLRRLMPGSIHPIRKNIHQLVFPIDYSNRDDLVLIAQQLRVLISRKVAMRFGLVPLLSSPSAIDQAKVIYHIQDNYGLQWTLKYIDQSLVQKDWTKPSQRVFDEVVKTGELLEGKKALTLKEVLENEELNDRISRAKKWGQRLGQNGPTPSIFLNGQPIPKNEDWAQTMHPKLEQDIMLIQQATYIGQLDDDSDYPAWYLNNAIPRRNPYIFPETSADLKIVNIARLVEENREFFDKVPKVNSAEIERTSETSLWIVGDFDAVDGKELLTVASQVQEKTPGLNMVLINNPKLITEKPELSTLLYHFQRVGPMTPDIFRGVLNELGKLIEKRDPQAEFAENFMDQFAQFAKEETWAYPDHIEAGTFWGDSKKLLKGSGLQSGQRGFIVNGRVVGPIPSGEEFTLEDLEALIKFEREKRITPVLKAAEDMGVIEKLTQTSEIALATLTNLISLAGISEVPLGVLEDGDLTRLDIRDRTQLKRDHSGFTIGNKETSTIQILTTLDPVSEKAQKWVPLLKVLTEMEGIYLEVYLNPALTYSELPIKRFYRHVLNTAPEFDDNGRLIDPKARFENIPEKVLLSFSMDVPPPWLVTPKECIYDLDNLMLDSLKSRLDGADIEALYELRNILVEGHSRDVETGGAPQGAQLILGSEKEVHKQDTIIMANLGYFQLKANPGLWRIELMEGRSKEIYNIETLGAKGPKAVVEKDEIPEVALISFRGATLFPKLGRKPGMETKKVLVTEEDEESEQEEKKGALGKAMKWFKKAEEIVAGKKPAVKTDLAKKPQAEINIFSVASGHLYERFLNIMMLSVMKHTNHTVKFWFIENFLSPSFKDFIPTMAAEYGFEYELVTYKWPHWLRSQTEKQREIWGYKILFLDVLFPLDLSKVIFVDADQIVRTDLIELINLPLYGAPYGFTPMCDSRPEIEGFRFWKQGYWKSFLRGLPYHISALYVVDLNRFRQIAAGDRLRQQYHTLSADPNSLANLDQDLPNHMQSVLPIRSLPQEWLWCETWCSDESLKDAKTIDLCNNPMTKEPKLDRARRQVPEWTAYDEEVAALARRRRKDGHGGHLGEARDGEGKVVVEKEDGKVGVKDEL